MSVFVAIAKGEYDNLLQWPFSYKVLWNSSDLFWKINFRFNYFKKYAKKN
jgi:hypothetical protein